MVLPSENTVDLHSKQSRSVDYEPGLVEYASVTVLGLAIALVFALGVWKHLQRKALRRALEEGDDLKPEEKDASSWWWSD